MTMRAVRSARQESGPVEGGSLSRVVAALIGPLYYRRWFSREPNDDKFVDLIVRAVLAAVPR
jgi:hypothetical protein